jgi:hypothetical protein
MYEILFSSNVISIVDFIENYHFEIQNEVQSMLCHNYEVHILVHITFQLNHNASMYHDDSCTPIEYHFYVYEDKKYDETFVQHCFKLH